MFYTYQPRNPQKCPVCGSQLKEWQGKDGPCALFVFAEGVSGSIRQEAGDLNIPEIIREKEKLPKLFLIFSYDCECPYPIEAVCDPNNGIWVKTRIIDLSTAKKRKEETKKDFKNRLKWLEGKAT